MPMAGVAAPYRPQSLTRASIGDIKGARGRAESAGVAFNLFPALGDILPELLEVIVDQTVDDVDATAYALAPSGETGKLKLERKKRYSRSRKTGSIISGRIDWFAEDPTKEHPHHEYPFYVEVGTEDTAAQPFVIPSIQINRVRFMGRLIRLEAAAKRKLGIGA